MIDLANITVKAGDGGDGAGSFRCIKGKRYGKADGGDGGDGGNVYCQATYDLNTLEPYRYLKDYQAKGGQNGLANLRRGANGNDLILKVPVGTMVKVENAGPVTTFPPASAPQPFLGQSNSLRISKSKKGGVCAVGSPSSRATRISYLIDLVEDNQKG